MKKICFYSSAAGYGGAEIYLENLIIGCLSHGYKCTLLYNKDNQRFLESAVSNGIKCVPIAIKGEYSLRQYFQLSKVLRDIKPDIFHINLPGPWNAQLISLVAKLSMVRSIVTTEHLPMFGPSIRHSLFKYIDSMLIDKCIAVSHDNVQYLRKLHAIPKEKIKVIHNGIDVAKYNLKINEDDSNIGTINKFNVGIVGRLTEQKGHKYAIEAFSILCKAHDDLVLSIYGDGELLDQCKGQVESLGISEHVVFHGFVSDMPQVYQNIDVLLMPSTFEALPLTLLESMASGVPAIASNINGIPEIIDNNVDGMLIRPREPQDIVDAVEEFISDSNKVHIIGHEARTKIQHNFSLDLMVKNTIDVYHEF